MNGGKPVEGLSRLPRGTTGSTCKGFRQRNSQTGAQCVDHARAVLFGTPYFREQGNKRINYG
jgi:hypothetical protein